MVKWIGVGALLLALAVGLGAFGAHGLRDKLDAYSMGVYEKAVFYHFVHALGILLIAGLAAGRVLEEGAAKTVLILLAAGILFFSGSLYLLAATGMRWLGAVTPLGGVSFIAAWILLAWKTLSVKD
jgi:uncharacterized membrane protein YgdD (TMEM256/DUF423 family)